MKHTEPLATRVQAGYQFAFQTQREEHSGETLPVEGELPRWLVGRLLRNGPGQFEAGDEPLCHWFDAYAMLRGFDIDGRNNTVTYTNRFVRSEDFEYARNEGGVRRMLPGTPPDRGLFTRARQTLQGAFQDNPSIGVQRVGTDVAAVTESPTAINVDPATLETKDQRDLTAGLPEVDLTLGHPHYDPDADTFVNFGVSYNRQTTYTLFERDPQTAQPTVVGRKTFDDAPYAHTFALTDRFAVFADVPYGLDTTGLLLDSVTGGTFVDNVEPFDRDARFVVFDRETGELRAEVPADPFFVFHHANAYTVDADDRPVAGGSRAVSSDEATDWQWLGDDGSTDTTSGEPAAVVIDLIAYPDHRALTELTIDGLAAGGPDVPTGDFVRYRVPLDGGRAERELLYGGQVEFPTINYRRRIGRSYRYAYLAGNDSDESLPTTLIKFDHTTRSATTWTPDGRAFPGEPLFEPAPGAKNEDTGVLLTTVLKPGHERTDLVVIDAREMTEIARAPLPHWLPYGYHGQFYRDTKPVRSMA